MKTVVLVKPGLLRATQTDPLEEPAPGSALVRVRRVGICGTDLHAFRGRQPFFTYPRILGHELGVEVLKVNANDRGIAAGDRCAVEPYLNCGHCIACRRGRPNCCKTLQVLGVHTDGGMREIIQVPVQKLHRSEHLSLDQLALVETLGIGAHAVQRAELGPDEAVLVVGAGPIGLAVMQFVQDAGARVIALDANPGRLAFCRDRLGVEQTVLAAGDSLQEISRLTMGDLPTAVFDATGNPSAMMAAFQYVAPGGRLIFVGLFQGDVTFNDPHFHRREMTLLATRNSTPADFARIIARLEAGEIDTTPWITHRADADEMIEQFPSWLEPASGVIKAMVSF